MTKDAKLLPISSCPMAASLAATAHSHAVSTADRAYPVAIHAASGINMPTLPGSGCHHIHTTAKFGLLNVF